MKFKIIDGETFITLQSGESVNIMTEKELVEESVKIENKYGQFIFTNDKENKEIPVELMLSSEEIIKKCDAWLDVYKNIYANLSKLALSEGYIKHNISLKLSFDKTVVRIAERFTKEYTHIKLDLVRLAPHFLNKPGHSHPLQEGISISLCEDNDDIIRYLMVNILEHYISINYNGTVIDLDIFIKDNKYILYTNLVEDKEGKYPIFTTLYHILSDAKYRPTILSLIKAHNRKCSPEDVISNAKRRIYNQMIPKELVDDFNKYSRRTIKNGYVKKLKPLE